LDFAPDGGAIFYFYEELRQVALGFDDEDAAEMTKKITLPK
jgi:hypothetical protein